MTHPMQTDPESYWNDEAGPRWIACQAMLDQVLAPVSESILGSAALRAGDRVLDVGCGAGSLARAAAEVVGSTGRVVGVDISRPMIDHARAALEPAGVDLVAADAQIHPFEARLFHAAISRFGVMFFRDSVAAFANVAGSLAPGGRIAFAVWQPVERNPWITWPVAAIADLLPDGPQDSFGSGDAPGPFRFADPDHGRSVLEAAGFTEIEIRGVDQPLTFRGTPDEIFQLVSQVGPLSRAVAELDDDTTEAAMERVRARIDQLHDDGSMSFPAAWWLLEARVV